MAGRVSAAAINAYFNKARISREEAEVLQAIEKSQFLERWNDIRAREHMALITKDRKDKLVEQERAEEAEANRVVRAAVGGAGGAAAGGAGGGGGGGGGGSGPPVFAILGHGLDMQPDYKKRNLLPPGITLVTICQYGENVQLEELCAGISLFEKEGNPAMLQNPSRYINEISSSIYSDTDFAAGRRIRVYTEGTLYPTLRVTPLADWSKQHYMGTVISGVRPYPIEPEHMPTPVGISVYSESMKGDDARLIEQVQSGPFKEHLDGGTKTNFSNMLYFRPNSNRTFDEDLRKRLYKGAVYPSAAMLATDKPLYQFKNDSAILLEDLFKMDGFKSGVFFFLICRGEIDNTVAIFDNTWRFIFPNSERIKDQSLETSYAFQMYRFRDEYGTIRDPISKMEYYLNVLNGTQLITSKESEEKTITFYLTPENFIKAGCLLVGQEEGKYEALTEKQKGLLPPTFPSNRYAFEKDEKFYASYRSLLNVAKTARSDSNAAHAERAERALRRDGGGDHPVASGGAGGGGGASAFSNFSSLSAASSSGSSSSSIASGPGGSRRKASSGGGAAGGVGLGGSARALNSSSAAVSAAAAKEEDNESEGVAAKRRAVGGGARRNQTKHHRKTRRQSRRNQRKSKLASRKRR